MGVTGTDLPARTNPFGPGLAPALVVATGLVVAGCQTAPEFGVVAATPITDIQQGGPPVAVDWSDPVDAKILIADFTLTAPTSVFVVGKAYRLEIRNLVPEDRTLIAPGFFDAIAVRQLVVASGKSRLEPVGFRADAMEALAFEATKIIAEMIPPGFEAPIEAPPTEDPANPFALGEPAEDLPADPFALDPPAEDLPEDPFALDPPAEDLPANPFALGEDAGDAPEPDVGAEAVAVEEPPVAPEPAQEVAENVIDGAPEEFAAGLAGERALAEALALRTIEAARAAADAAAQEAEAAAVAAAEAESLAAAEAAAIALAEALIPDPEPEPEPEPIADPGPEPIPEAPVEPAPEVALNIEADLAPELAPAPAPEPIIEPAPILPLDEATELALLADWTANAPQFSAPDGLPMPANSSLFLTFIPLKPGVFDFADDSRIGALRTFGTITFVTALGGGGQRLSEAAPAAANLAMLIAEAKEGGTVTLPLAAAPIEPPAIVPQALAAPVEPPAAPTPAENPPPLDPPALGDDPGIPDDI